MISLIICSTTQTIQQELKSNLQQTIGVEYELISIDNSENKYSIFEAYNIGVERSKYDICCFMHQDILYRTSNWGNKVVQHFQNQQIGLIGVAGTRFLGKIPSYWSRNEKYNETNIIQSDSEKENPTKHFLQTCSPDKIAVNVACVDGVWFCIRKSLFKSVKFDENFQGFHFYDLDICMQIRQKGYDINSVFDIDIEHFSWGTPNIGWLTNAFVFFKKWKSQLPVSTEKIQKTSYYNLEYHALEELIKFTDYSRNYNYIFDILLYIISFKKVSALALIYRYKRYFLRLITSH